ncbi:MAG TPA: hypothetical protein VLT47_11080 [Anaeromyxobacteraceae bacterium]|nr:hypothetical protein [Anaeromyxobacteraceae bacterium]
MPTDLDAIEARAKKATLSELAPDVLALLAIVRDVSKPKPSVDQETYDHIERIYERARAHEWAHKYDARYDQTYDRCEVCGAKFWQGEPKHDSGCPLATSLAFMETWLRVEGDLLRGQEDA